VGEEAEGIKPARGELIGQAAKGEVLPNDDTGMRVLKLERAPGDQRTGVFTSGMVSTAAGRQMALYFTGRQHAGENIAEVLKQRVRESGPAIQVRRLVVERAEVAGRGGVAGGPRKTAGGGGGDRVSALASAFCDRCAGLTMLACCRSAPVGWSSSNKIGASGGQQFSALAAALLGQQRIGDRRSTVRRHRQDG